MKSSKTLTVFTPSFNRAYCLHQCYESLVAQTNKDFCWLIIDDGSSDNTEVLVQSWIEESKIEIIYHYQENQGMHGAHNTAYQLAETELNVCIDSDDFMPDDAVENILTFWNAQPQEVKKTVGGIIGLDAFKDGKVIGNRFPDDLKKSTLETIHNVHHITGDKKLVYRTEIVKKYPSYPIFKEERFVPLGTLYLMIDKDYEILCLNKVLCIVEYMPDGSSRNMMKQYYRHPRGFQHARIVNMKYSNHLKVRLKNAIHYVSHSIQLKDTGFLKKTPRKLLTFLMIPPGLLLFTYVWYNNKIRK
nr:glycosyltransferase family A protein [Allomuricauda sp.]